MFVFSCVAVIADAIALIATSQRFTPSYLRVDFGVACLLNLVNFSWMVSKLAQAEKAVESDRQRYEEQWGKVVQQHGASIHALNKRMHRWKTLAGSEKSRECRQLNCKRVHVQETAKGLSTGIHEKGGFFRFSGVLDPEAPVTSLDQVGTHVWLVVFESHAWQSMQECTCVDGVPLFRVHALGLYTAILPLFLFMQVVVQC
jgi:hypothetical protein